MTRGAGMTPSDLAALHGRCFATPPPWTPADFAGLLVRPGVSLLCDPARRGFALIRVVADEAELLTIATEPEARRQGVARVLMSQVLAAAKGAGASVLFLEVAENNTAARQLYDGCGFAQAGRRRGYYRTNSGDLVDALILRRPIDRDFSAA